ncbi:MAG TPA: aldose 1-epimerase family protein, partial [Planctomycetaceae bacterium]|nr:aldose 1-epimerase family protein [Planctomycetaceae bacterium]
MATKTMTDTTITLTDTAEGVWHRDFRLNDGNGPRLAGSPQWSITRETLRGGTSAGVDVVHLFNGALRLSILPTRGMGLWKGLFRSGASEIELGWQSPVRQPVHPAFVNLAEHTGLGWLQGFNEWLCRCGLAWNGPPGVDVVTRADGTVSEAPLTLHGRIANTPAHHVEAGVSADGPGRLWVRGVVDEVMMFGPCLRLISTVETQAGSNGFRITDEVQNLAGRPGEMQLLYHTNIGRPFVEAGSRFFAAVRELAPRDAAAARGLGTWPDYEPPTPEYAEQVFLIRPVADEHGQTRVLLSNAARERGLSLRFNIRELPCFSLWKCTRAEADGCVTGLEPATGFPNFKSFERGRGRVIALQPEETWRAGIEFAVHAGRDAVADVEREIESL